MIVTNFIGYNKLAFINTMEMRRKSAFFCCLLDFVTIALNMAISAEKCLPNAINQKKFEWYTFNVDVKLHQTGRIEVCHTANNGNRVYHCQIKH